MLDTIVFYFAEDSENKGIDANEMKELADGCNLAVINVLKADYPFVAEPGPDVLRVRWAITDLKQSKPVLGLATTVLPVGLAFNLVKKTTTDTWTGAGATSSEVMILDSMTNDVVGVALGDKTADFDQRYTKWGSTEEAFKYWANYLRLFLFSHTK